MLSPFSVTDEKKSIDALWGEFLKYARTIEAKTDAYWKMIGND